MLTFLYHAAKAGFTVERYEDNAEGVLAKNEQGRLAITRCTLKPRVQFTGQAADARRTRSSSSSGA